MTGRPRARSVALGVAAVVLVAALAAGLAAALLRPTAAAPAAPAPASAAPPAVTPTPAPADDARQHQEYRAYVSTVVRGATAVLASAAGLAGCRTSRQECVARLAQASDQVAAFRRDLATTSPPACLAAADQRLQDALSFAQTGLDTARDGVGAENRVRLVQGLLLTGVGLWRGGQAIVAGRQSDC